MPFPLIKMHSMIFFTYCMSSWCSHFFGFKCCISLGLLCVNTFAKNKVQNSARLVPSTIFSSLLLLLGHILFLEYFFLKVVIRNSSPFMPIPCFVILTWLCFMHASMPWQIVLVLFFFLLSQWQMNFSQRWLCCVAAVGRYEVLRMLRLLWKSHHWL